MKPWHRVIAFFIFIVLFVIGSLTLKRLYNFAFIGACVSGYHTSLCDKAEKNFINGVGYWKDIYKAYYLVARIEYKKGNLYQAKILINQALHFHPYFPNGYKMLSLLQGLDTPEGKACLEVYKEIMIQGIKPENNLINSCLSKVYEPVPQT